MKSRTTSFILTLLFSVLGLFYASPLAAVIVLVLAVVTIPLVPLVGYPFWWVMCIAIGDHAVVSHNREREQFIKELKG
jgi:low affinity Fe/Cu permease